MLRYLKFLIKSTNQHGVHSPFVYQLVTQCFYDKVKYPDYKLLLDYTKKKDATISLKQAKLLYRLVRYFNVKTVLTNTPNDRFLKSCLNLSRSGIVISDVNHALGFYNLLFFDRPVPKYLSLALKHVHNNSIVVFNNIHSSKATSKNWKYLKNNPKITVTIDMFYFGFVFIRKEQTKENFVIRC